MTTIVSWNIAGRTEPWKQLLEMDVDIALLQEAAQPPSEVQHLIECSPGPWLTPGADALRRFRATIVRLSDRVKVEWIEAKGLLEAEWNGLAVSRPGTLAAAKVTPSRGAPFLVCSLYGMWEGPHETTRSQLIMADASVHRLVSDLSVFIGRQAGHRIIASGDLNILYGHGEEGSPYWAARYKTVFDRMEAIGLSFVGPQSPKGRQADPWPKELPGDSKNVPTFHSNRGGPELAYRQLDYTFASRELAPSVTVRALNGVDEWGPSDHCRVLIEVNEG